MTTAVEQRKGRIIGIGVFLKSSSQDQLSSGYRDKLGLPQEGGEVQFKWRSREKPEIEHLTIGDGISFARLRMWSSPWNLPVYLRPTAIPPFGKARDESSYRSCEEAPAGIRFWMDSHIPLAAAISGATLATSDKNNPATRCTSNRSTSWQPADASDVQRDGLR
jgi:hypothetical protein